MSEIWVIEERIFDGDCDDGWFSEWSAGKFIDAYGYESEEKANFEIDRIKRIGCWPDVVEFRAAKYTRTEPQE